ncbi:hypothetical protein [Cellulomonas iranensis]|uniref:hypothetical protein n=1 Tax=Cellulomonas iranensis TaxID=76862 RepID=UPI00211B0C14|nr:hypothetical protein [Cellulomonas iranensis]
MQPVRRGERWGRSSRPGTTCKRARTCWPGGYSPPRSTGGRSRAVYTPLTRPSDETAVDILCEYGFLLTADQVAGVVSAPEKQRGGVFGTAQQMDSWLTNRQVAA